MAMGSRSTTAAPVLSRNGARPSSAAARVPAAARVGLRHPREPFSGFFDIKPLLSQAPSLAGKSHLELVRAVRQLSRPSSAALLRTATSSDAYRARPDSAPQRQSSSPALLGATPLAGASSEASKAPTAPSPAPPAAFAVDAPVNDATIAVDSSGPARSALPNRAPSSSQPLPLSHQSSRDSLRSSATGRPPSRASGSGRPPQQRLSAVGGRQQPRARPTPWFQRATPPKPIPWDSPRAVRIGTPALLRVGWSSEAELSTAVIHARSLRKRQQQRGAQ